MKRATSELRTNFKYLLALWSSVLNNTPSPKPHEQIDWKTVFAIANAHSLVSMTYYGILKLDKEYRPEPAVEAVFKQYKNESVVTDINFTVETENLLTILGDSGIRCVPLKGILLKNDYPSPDIRSMSDVDILVDKDKQNIIYELMKARGYTREFVGLKDVSYRKDEFLHFEMHSSLVSEKSKAYEYFSSVWERVRPTDKNNVYSLNANDTYIYMLEHLASHLERGGAGVRMVMDVYVYLSKHNAELDTEYVNKILHKLKLKSFEKKIRAIAENWFSGKEEINTDSEAAEFILCSATFGNSENFFLSDALKNDADTKGKATAKGIRLIFSKLFPGYKEIAYRYSWVKKLPVLYPFGVVVYWIQRAFVKKDVNTSNIGRYFALASSEKANQLKEVYLQLGLDKRL